MHSVRQSINKERDSFRYQLIVSSLRRFIPMLRSEECDNFLEQVLINQALAYREQTDTQMLRQCRCILAEPLDAKPRIYVSFHLSSYRLNMLYLLQNRLPITLVASRDVIDEQGQIIQKSCAQVSGQASHNIIDANQSNSIMTMVRELKNGYSIFAFVDGNTGLDGMTSKNKHQIRVPLLNSCIMARTGLIYLSKITDTPIVPMITYRKNGEFPTIHIFPSISPKSIENKDEYANRAIRIMYQHLNNALELYANQYEPWLYIYKFADKTSISPVQTLGCERKNKFNDIRFNSFVYKDKYYILDNADFSVIEVDKDVSAVLQQEKIDLQQVAPKYRNYFLQHQIVI